MTQILMHSTIIFFPWSRQWSLLAYSHNNPLKKHTKIVTLSFVSVKIPMDRTFPEFQSPDNMKTGNKNPEKSNVWVVVAT